FGDVTVSATANGRTVTARVKVGGGRADPAFRKHVVPVLTRAGCNSGACHGALAGKGGMKLSLRGYDPDADHFVLTRQALARRVDLQEPSRSLFLQKPTSVVNHGGGRRLEIDSPEFAVLADWVASGAPRPLARHPALTRLAL